MEKAHVHAIYERIAQKFNHTRFSYWNAVRQFLDALPNYSLVADVGTGNGKYLTYRNDITVVGNDMCDNLLHIISNKNKNANILRANALQLPYRPSMFDAVISIAVFHHIESVDGRLQFIKELIRIMKPQGICLITVWAKEQPIKKTWKDIGNGDFFVPWVDTEKNIVYDRYYHLFSREEVNELFSYHEQNDEIDIKSISFEMNNWCIILEKR